MILLENTHWNHTWDYMHTSNTRCMLSDQRGHIRTFCCPTVWWQVSEWPAVALLVLWVQQSVMDVSLATRLLCGVQGTFQDWAGPPGPSAQSFPVISSARARVDHDREVVNGTSVIKRPQLSALHSDGSHFPRQVSGTLSLSGYLCLPSNSICH